MSRKATLIYRAKRSGEVFEVIQKNGCTRTISITPKPVSEYINSIQLYNPSMNGKAYQDYYEKDPFSKKQNEVIRVAEMHPTVKKEYSIMKDIHLTQFISQYLYSLISPKYKDGKKKRFSLIDFFKQVSEEDEIRSCYELFTTAQPLKNWLEFKDLGISKWDRINWLRGKRILKIDL